MSGSTAVHKRLTRRQFVQRAAASSAAVGYFVSTAPLRASRSVNERLQVAAVGTANRALANIRGVSTVSRGLPAQIVALADVDANLLGKTAEEHRAAATYRDYRHMLEKEEKRIDAVLVGTPDHSHAPAAAMALRMKKHVYCEKPLTHTVFEARTLARLAAENQLVTQMGTQIHAGNNYRRVVELVQAGAIGPIREVHVWAAAAYSGGHFDTGTPAPSHLDWDLWLGPAPQRPYSTGVHPFQWRKFWDYGTGALGDFGCHYMDLPHWALQLKHPVRIAARGPQPLDPVSTPSWNIVEYDYPQRGELPPVHLTWYDSGKRPELLDSLRMGGKPVDWRSGQLFVGRDGMILSDYSRHVLLPEDRFADFKRPEPTIPDSVGHHQEWLEAIRDGGTTTCNFEYSGALTEAVLLGTVAYRSGQTLEWDGPAFKLRNAPEAAPLLHKEYRQGWSL